MTANLMDLCNLMVERIKGSPELRKFTSEYKHIYQFEGKDFEPFYLQVDHGQLAVFAGIAEADANSKSTLQTDAHTLREFLTGKLKPLDAAEQGKWNIRARNYSGNLLILLFRLNQEKVIEELLKNL